MKKLILLLLLTAVSFSLLSQENNEKKPEKNEMKPALVVIDIQNEFLKYMSSDKDMAMEMINWAIWVARQNDIPVIRVYHTDPESGPEPGSEAFAFPKTIQIKDDDPKVIKNYPDGFKKTDLDKILTEKGCNTLFLCGLSATGCVLATYHGAMDLDYNVFMLRDAIISHDHQLTDAVEKICESVSLETFNFMMKNLIR
jgi:nicotinamidase-related amidase